MRHSFLVAVLTLMLSAPALAVNVEVEALSDFSTDNPPSTYSVKVVDTVVTKKGNIEKGTIIKGKVSVKDAKRLKQDATFSFIPTQVTTPEGEVIKAKKTYIGKYRKEIDKKKIARTAALTAGNFALKGFSTGFNAIEGAVKNEQGNVLKSTAVAVYEGSPVSYIEKGKALELQRGQRFYMNFDVDEEHDVVDTETKVYPFEADKTNEQPNENL